MSLILIRVRVIFSLLSCLFPLSCISIYFPFKTKITKRLLDPFCSHVGFLALFSQFKLRSLSIDQSTKLSVLGVLLWNIHMPQLLFICNKLIKTISPFCCFSLLFSFLPLDPCLQWYFFFLFLSANQTDAIICTTFGLRLYFLSMFLSSFGKNRENFLASLCM